MATMFSVVRRSTLRLQRHNRSFVSSVLLSKTWETETVAELRKEARNRGLSTKGNKASLVSRIQEYEKVSFSSEHAPSYTPPIAVRNASTPSTSVALEGEVPGKPTPPDATSPPDADSFFKVNLPDLSVPEPEPPIQVPYVPDLWNSEQVTELIESAAAEDAPIEPTLPKLVVVAGESTHPAGGPSHNLLDTEASLVESEPIPTSQPTSTVEQGFWGDVAEDIGIPQWTEVKKGFRGLF